MMPTRSTTGVGHALGALVIGMGLALGAATASAASAASDADIEARYRLDVERCNTGQTNQDKATCLREAGAARDEARRNRLTNANESYRQNETARCQALPADQREDCMLQMSGQNTTTRGSVGGGGVLRETTIEVPGTPAPASGVVPGATSPVPPALPAPALTPNPPPAVPAPSLTPATPVSPATPASPAAPATTVPVPGTGIMK